MSGHRKKSGKPIKAVASAQRRQARFEERLRASQDPWDAFVAVYDYLRSTLHRGDHSERLTQLQSHLRQEVTAAEQANLARARQRQVERRPR